MTRSQKDQGLIHNFRTFYPIQKNVGFLFRVSNNSEYQGDFHPICWQRQRGKDSARSGYFRRWNLWVLGISLDVCFRDTVQVSGGLGVRILSMIMRSLGVELESRGSGTQIFKKKKKVQKGESWCFLIQWLIPVKSLGYQGSFAPHSEWTRRLKCIKFEGLGRLRRLQMLSSHQPWRSPIKYILGGHLNEYFNSCERKLKRKK